MADSESGGRDRSGTVALFSTLSEGWRNGISQLSPQEPNTKNESEVAPPPWEIKEEEQKKRTKERGQKQHMLRQLQSLNSSQEALASFKASGAKQPQQQDQSEEGSKAAESNHGGQGDKKGDKDLAGKTSSKRSFRSLLEVPRLSALLCSALLSLYHCRLLHVHNSSNEGARWRSVSPNTPPR